MLVLVSVLLRDVVVSVNRSGSPSMGLVPTVPVLLVGKVVDSISGVVAED